MLARRIWSTALAAALVLGGGVATTILGASPASADGCYTWSRTLKAGLSGSDVTQLQIRVAGWAGYNIRLALDGDYGPQTTAAVRRFQSSYGLTADGIAGSATFAKLYALQDNDCTPIHFTVAEASPNCGRGTAGMTASQRSNLIKALWRAEALRQRLGNHPLPITSGWRDEACNTSVGGKDNSKHLTGEALDFDSTSYFSLCKIAQEARYTGFGGIFGPGYTGHSDHVHGDIRSAQVWDAPNCSGL